MTSEREAYVYTAQEIADAALSRAQQVGVEHADVRIEKIRTGIGHLVYGVGRLQP